jgi:hypothetical protein
MRLVPPPKIRHETCHTPDGAPPASLTPEILLNHPPRGEDETPISQASSGSAGIA